QHRVRRPRDPDQRLRLDHDLAHRGEREGVAGGVDPEDHMLDGPAVGCRPTSGAHDPSRNRRTTLCSSRLRVFSSCAAEVIRATAAVWSSMMPPAASVELALASATSEISPTALTISSLPASCSRALWLMRCTFSAPLRAVSVMLPMERTMMPRSSRPSVSSSMPCFIAETTATDWLEMSRATLLICSALLPPDSARF